MELRKSIRNHLMHNCGCFSPGPYFPVSPIDSGQDLVNICGTNYTLLWPPESVIQDGPTVKQNITHTHTKHVHRYYKTFIIFFLWLLHVYVLIMSSMYKYSSYCKLILQNSFYSVLYICYYHYFVFYYLLFFIFATTELFILKYYLAFKTRLLLEL